MADKVVFVTVGTTSFDQLIETVSSKNICQVGHCEIVQWRVVRFIRALT